MFLLKLIYILFLCNIVNIIKSKSLPDYSSNIKEGKELEIFNNIKSKIDVSYDKCPISHDVPVISALNIESEKIKKLLTFVLYKIPYIGSPLEGFSIAFWPDQEKDVWLEIKDKVKNVIDKNTLLTISGILSGDIRMYKERINQLSSEIKNPTNNASSHYMNIAEDLIGFENKFMFDKNYADYKNINYHLLPLYSTVISMKASYYTIGIKYSKKIGLTSNEVLKIKNYITNIIKSKDGANNYINNMLEDSLNNAYSTSNQFNIYNKIMSIKGHIGIHGLEYIPMWNNLIDNPFSDEKININIISYSILVGRVTLNINKQLLNISQPLTPNLINGTRNAIVSIGVYIWRIHNAPRIGGINIFFKNGDNYSLGESTSEYKKFDLNGSVIKTLQVHGDGAIDRLVFYLSDKRILSYGEEKIPKPSNRNYEKKFEEDSHHISSLFLSNDAYNCGLAGQAANIAVSYQLD
ncbi:uncharacterized protein LOC113556839 [Rhopalosiphum maidis]|uniref:uncharacterized protein LOC113556839 n=1 Tax=Rhopalosiphum maidis TaxID=43146 RepID=UPI000EFF68D0|nr:uncharacterized protein LOC113556839 [Rhopalosiphum maidis]